MTDEKEREHDEKAPKFKIIDKRRIDPDDLDDLDDVEEDEVEAPEMKVVSDETTEAPSRPEAGEASSDAGFKPKFAPGVDAPPPQKELNPDEDPLAFQNILLNIIQTVVTVALIDLGLVPHPQTNLVAKKLDQAQKSIQLFDLLMKHYGNELPEQVRTEFNRALQDLKSGFVNQM